MATIITCGTQLRRASITTGIYECTCIWIKQNIRFLCMTMSWPQVGRFINKHETTISRMTNKVNCSSPCLLLSQSTWNAAITRIHTSLPRCCLRKFWSSDHCDIDTSRNHILWCHIDQFFYGVVSEEYISLYEVSTKTELIIHTIMIA